MENQLEKYEEIGYHLEVDHEPGTFDDDMDFLTKSAQDAYERLQFLKEKYKDKRINITEIKEITLYRSLLESDLEKIVKSQGNIDIKI